MVRAIEGGVGSAALDEALEVCFRKNRRAWRPCHNNRVAPRTANITIFLREDRLLK